MCTTAMLMYVAGMMLLTDDGCCTTFPLCTWRPHLIWRKSRLS